MKRNFRSDFIKFISENPFATNDEIRISLNISQFHAKRQVYESIKRRQVERVFENGCRKLIVIPNNKYLVKDEEEFLEETDDIKNSIFQEILDDLMITIRSTTNESDKREAQRMVIRILEQL